MQAWYSLGMFLQSGRCLFHPLLHEASPMATIEPLCDNDSSLACGLVVLSFMPSDVDLVPLDASSCKVGLVACHCRIRLVVLQSSVCDSV